MKVYCRQIAPEYQKSPLFYDDMFPDNIAVCGNKEYKEHLPDVFERVWDALKNGEIAEAVDDIKNGGYYSFYKTITQAFNNMLYPEKDRYSTKDINKLKRLVVEFSECSSHKEDSILCAVLSIVTGDEWKSRQINGCAQDEWNYVFYPVKQWSEEALEEFEGEYFNTGTEWSADDGEFDPENDTPDNINGCSVYVTAWDKDGIKQEIASALGESPDDVVLYAFDGWIRTPHYREEV